MRQKTLGQGPAALEVSAEGLGCMGMSQSYGPADESEAIATIRAALDAGVNLFDTADVYGPFTNEQLIGRALGGHRHEAIVSTKFGYRINEDGSKEVHGDPGYVKAACDASLRRLGIEHIDLYYQHRIDLSVPVEETWGALSELVTAGKVGHLGISEASPETIRRAHAVHPITALQAEWSLWSRDVEADGLLATVRDLGIGFVAYSPISRGLLSGRITNLQQLDPGDSRHGSPRFQGENLATNLELVARIGQLADRRRCEPAQLALAWVLAQGPDVVAIPGTKQRDHLASNVAAVEIDLDADDLDALDQAAPIGAGVGNRYPADMMVTVRR